MGEEHRDCRAFCAPRMDNSSNGLVRDYMFLVGTDGEQWEAVSGGTWLPYYAGVYFEPVKARYFRLVALAGQYASISGNRYIARGTLFFTGTCECFVAFGKQFSFL